MLERNNSKPRCEKNFADRDDFTCIGPSTYAIQDTSEDWVAFFRNRHCPLPREGGCLAAPVAGDRDGITGCCRWATRSAAQAKNPPPVQYKLLITKHLMMKSGGVRKVKGIEAGESELPLDSLIGSELAAEEKSRLAAEEKSWSLWRSTPLS